MFKKFKGPFKSFENGRVGLSTPMLAIRGAVSMAIIATVITAWAKGDLNCSGTERPKPVSTQKISAPIDEIDE